MTRQIKLNVKDFWHPDTIEEIHRNPFVSLLSKRFQLRISSDPDFLIYSCHGQEFSKFSCTRIFYTGENIRPDFNECDFAFSFDHTTDARNFRLPNYHLFWSSLDKLLAPRAPEQVFAEKTKFCNFIYSHEGCEDRENFYRLLSKYRRIDSPGAVFNNMPGLGARRDHHWFSQKVEFMHPYKFSIVFENSSFPGYTTEKLLSAMLAGSIGIYWGNPLVARDFNPGAFINCHDYDDFDSVVAHVRDLDNDDDAYKRYLAEPCFTNNKLNPAMSIDSVLDRFEAIFDGRQ